MPYPPYPIKLQAPVSIHLHGGPYDGMLTQSCSPVLWAQYPAPDDLEKGIHLIFPGDGLYAEVHEYWYELIETLITQVNDHRGNPIKCLKEITPHKQMGYRYVGRLKRL